MFIQRFRVRNYMVHRDLSADFHPITVLVGPNNGGKSSLFDALNNFSMVGRGRVQHAFGPGPYSYYFRKHRGAGPADRISFEARFSDAPESDDWIDYVMSYSQVGAYDPTGDAPPTFVIQKEKITDASGKILFDRDDSTAYSMGSASAHLADDRSIFAAIRSAQLEGSYDEVHATITLVAREIGRITKFRLDPQNLSRPSRIPDIATESPNETPPPRIDYRGEDLASVLYFLEETADPRLQQIIERITKVLPSFKGFEFNTVGTDRIGFSALFSDAQWSVPAANLSDGTLTLVGLITLLTSPGTPAVLCLEEPENGLTPSAIKVIYECMRDLALREDPSKRSQVIVSSHSPFVICAAWNGDDRDFIYRVSQGGGESTIHTFASIINQENIQLRKKDGQRIDLGLQQAQLVMEGFYD